MPQLLSTECSLSIMSNASAASDRRDNRRGNDSCGLLALRLIEQQSQVTIGVVGLLSIIGKEWPKDLHHFLGWAPVLVISQRE